MGSPTIIDRTTAPAPIPYSSKTSVIGAYEYPHPPSIKSTARRLPSFPNIGFPLAPIPPPPENLTFGFLSSKESDFIRPPPRFLSRPPPPPSPPRPPLPSSSSSS